MSYDKLIGRVEHITETLACVEFTNFDKVSEETKIQISKFDDKERVAYYVTTNEHGKPIVVMSLIEDNIILGYN